MKNTIKNKLPLIITFSASAIVVIAAFFYFPTAVRNNASEVSDKSSEYKKSETPTNWIKLSNEELGITIMVPRKISVYRNLEQEGCEQQIIFGTVDRSSSVYLMPEFVNCKEDNSLRGTYAFEDTMSKRVTILPVDTISEIKGIIKSHIITDSLATTDGRDALCKLNTLTVSLPKNNLTDLNDTVPVDLKTGESCPISQRQLIVQYSPTHKKVVLFESIYGYSEGGDFHESSTTWDKTVDFDVYRSIKVLR